MKIVMISDTHDNLNYTLPEGDVLIHCGDLTNLGDLANTSLSLKNLKAKAWGFSRILLIAGNHDFAAQQTPQVFEEMCALQGITYLNERGCEIEGVRFYGTPWTPTFYNWAFMESESDLVRRYSRIPDDTDVLITHGPPYGILDKNIYGDPCGSHALLNRVLDLKPSLHCYGHLHESYGITSKGPTTFVNAAVTNERNKLDASHLPITFTL